MPRLPHLYSASYGILRDADGRILLMERTNTNWYDGHFGVPSGHLEPGESPSGCLAREMREEVGIEVVRFRLAATIYRDEGKPYVDYFFVVEEWTGEPRNMEPEKCSRLGWFGADALPEKIVPPLDRVLAGDLSSLAYWEQ